MTNDEHYFRDDIGSIEARKNRRADKSIANDNHWSLRQLQETAYAELLAETRRAMSELHQRAQDIPTADDRGRTTLGELARIKAEFEGDGSRGIVRWWLRKE